MSSKRAFITGVNGQDGSYLAEILLKNDYEVTGLVRPSGDDRLWRLRNVLDNPKFSLKYGDILDHRLGMQVAMGGFDEVYHLAAMPFVGQSFSAPVLAFKTNAVATVSLLDALYVHAPTTKFYFAATSEMFASMTPPAKNDEQGMLDARSPYGAAKIAAYLTCRTYRERGMFVVNGIAFNHESVRRGTNYVTRKVGIGVRQFKKTGKPVKLGNIESQRDWHHAYDTMVGAFAAMRAPQSDDYVFASGQTRSVAQLAQAVCGHFGMIYEEAIQTTPAERRPWDVEYLCGDSSKARKQLDWVPQYTWAKLVEEVCRPEGDI